jgi:pyruvate dehydrogenase E1 component alpha subunit
MTSQDLIDFEEDIANCFNNKQIKAPVHLYNGNEEQIIKIFEFIKPQDWVFCSWRSHYQCLLKGVPKLIVKKRILEGKSITLSFPEYKLYSSAIVGGIVPIALGTAFSNKLKQNNETVWVFSGEMTVRTGTWRETYAYAIAHDLPIKFIEEDNGKSVCTPTDKVWNYKEFKNDISLEDQLKSNQKYIYYKYESKYPHAGAGQRIQF